MSLSGKQLEILRFLYSYQEMKGYPPSIREICDAVSLRSTSTVHGHLSKLEAKGYIQRDPAKSRTIEICRMPEEGDLFTLPPADSQPLPSSSHRKGQSHRDPRKNLPELTSLPILSRVRTGESLLSEDNIEGYFAVPQVLVGKSECFILRVQGESMINAGIYEGDLVVVRSQKRAANRDIVVALLGDNVTVNRYFKEKGFIRLQPENDYMGPILIKDCTILGKVIGLFRKM